MSSAGPALVGAEPGEAAPYATTTTIRPTPSPAEAAAIVAAIQAVWPRPAGAAPTGPPPRWRFAGRWWSKPVPARRDRPY
jgi:hypothetical protein